MLNYRCPACNQIAKLPENGAEVPDAQDTQGWNALSSDHASGCDVGESVAGMTAAIRAKPLLRPFIKPVMGEVSKFICKMIRALGAEVPASEG